MARKRNKDVLGDEPSARTLSPSLDCEFSAMDKRYNI
jgi:hypothetical protein